MTVDRQMDHMKNVPQQERGVLIKAFMKYFEDETIAEYHHLQDVGRGNQSPRVKINRLGSSLKIVISLASLLPIAGQLLGSVVNTVNTIVEEGGHFTEKIPNNSVQQINDFCNRLSNLKEADIPNASVDEDFAVLDEEQLKLFAKRVASFVARRYEFAITWYFEKEQLKLFAGEGARRLWAALFSNKNNIESKDEAHRLLTGVFQGDEGPQVTCFQNAKARWSQFNSGTKVPVRKDIQQCCAKDINIERLYACPAFVDDNNIMYTYKSSNALKYGYAAIRSKDELPNEAVESEEKNTARSEGMAR